MSGWTRVTLDATERARLGELAWAALLDGVAGQRPHPGLGALPDVLPDALRAPGASFVTLERPRGRLRGCIGSLSAWRPLARDVAQNAWSAAFEDPRFEPLSAEELAGLHLHLSVLAPPEPFPVRDEADACARLQPGAHGVVLHSVDPPGRRATFLPSVWEGLPEPRDFLAQLKRKAGLPADTWPVRLEVYTVQEWDAPALAG